MYLPSQVENEYGDSLGINSTFMNNNALGIRGVSIIRDNMTMRIESLNLERPYKNKIIKERDNLL